MRVAQRVQQSQGLGIQRTGDERGRCAADREMKLQAGQNEWMDDESQRVQRERELVSSMDLGGAGGISPYRRRTKLGALTGSWDSRLALYHTGPT